MSKQKRSPRTTIGDRIDGLRELIADNHNQTIERLTRLETQYDTHKDLPDRVAKLEEARSQFKGGWIVISAAITWLLTFFGMRHH